MANSKRQRGRLISEKRQSFDVRVCDDLSEELLQYLTIEDKLRLECVSKQFQRTVFTKHNNLVFDPRKWGHKLSKHHHHYNNCNVDCNRLAKVLSKAQNITKIAFHCYYYDQNYHQNFIVAIENLPLVFATLFQNCNNLKTLDLTRIDLKIFKFSEEFLNQLGQLAPGLENVILDYDLFRLGHCYSSFGERLGACPPNWHLVPNCSIHNLLSKLRINPLTLRGIPATILQSLEFYCNRFDQNLTHLSITFITNSISDEKKFFLKLSELKTLKELKVKSSRSHSLIHPPGCTDHFWKCIEPIANNCRQLKSLKINLDYINVCCEDVTFSFGKFNNLKKLAILLRNQKLHINPSESCPKLTHLNIRYMNVNHEFYERIDSIVPNLTHLEFTCLQMLQFTNILKLKKLKHLKITNDGMPEDICDSDCESIKSILESCKRLQTIRFENYSISSQQLLKRFSGSDSQNLFKYPRSNFSHF
jgi:hypothetical protein